MVEHKKHRLGLIYGALSDDHRRGMLQRLSRGSKTVGELAEPLPMSFAAASKHVTVLERAGLVRRKRVGREHHITINEQPLVEAADWATRTAAFWTRRLDQLEEYFNEPSRGDRK
jgi:DNA-binding transcriptional ArsR family regulator